MRCVRKARNRIRKPSVFPVKRIAGPASWVIFTTLRLAALILFLGATFSPANINAVEPWQEALAAMPLKGAPVELNRTNCVKTVLGGFTSNALIRAVVFMPGATDELYLFRRVKVSVTNTSPTLLDAVSAMTKQSHIRATFHAPFLLLHTDEDPLTSANTIENERTAMRLKRVRIERLNCDDWDWDALQPVLKRDLKLALRPWRYSTGSWHFYRHSFAAWNLNGFEALEVAALAGKSKFTLHRHEAVFEVDPRVLAAPQFDAHLR
jgi:hypothetical protein